MLLFAQEVLVHHQHQSLPKNEIHVITWCGTINNSVVNKVTIKSPLPPRGPSGGTAYPSFHGSEHLKVFLLPLDGMVL